MADPARSRDSLLTLRRVERQQRLVEELAAAREPVTLERLAWSVGAATRTVARDLARLRDSGVPIVIDRGRAGGARLAVASVHPEPIALDVPELAALIASLAALGPTSTESSRSAMHRLVTALTGSREPRLEP